MAQRPKLLQADYVKAQGVQAVSTHRTVTASIAGSTVMRACMHALLGAQCTYSMAVWSLQAQLTLTVHDTCDIKPCQEYYIQLCMWEHDTLSPTLW